MGNGEREQDREKGQRREDQGEYETEKDRFIEWIEYIRLQAVRRVYECRGEERIDDDDEERKVMNAKMNEEPFGCS